MNKNLRLAIQIVSARCKVGTVTKRQVGEVLSDILREVERLEEIDEEEARQLLNETMGNGQR